MDILYQKVKDGDTVIATMHDINLAANYCDYLIFIKDGNIITKDNTNCCLNSKTIKQVFNVESKIYTDSKTEKRCIYFFRRGG